MAMGKSLNQMIEAVADAATGEFERLKEFGIKAKSQGDQVTFTFQGISTTIGKNSKEIEGYFPVRQASSEAFLLMEGHLKPVSSAWWVNVDQS